MQIAGPAGQMLEIAFVDNGLYAASHLGSLRLPSTQMDLRYLRALLVEASHNEKYTLNPKEILWID